MTVDYLILAAIVLLCIMAALLVLFLWELYNAVQQTKHFDRMQAEIEERESVVRRMQR